MLNFCGTLCDLVLILTKPSLLIAYMTRFDSLNQSEAEVEKWGSRLSTKISEVEQKVADQEAKLNQAVESVSGRVETGVSVVRRLRAECEDFH